MRFLAMGEMVENRIRVGTEEIMWSLAVVERIGFRVGTEEILRFLSVRVGGEQNESRDGIENLFLKFTPFL